MKRIISALIVCSAVLFFSGPVYAVDVHFSAGLKTWYNSWESTFKDSTGTTTTVESEDPVLMAGPSLKLTAGKFLAGISYMTTTQDYEFSVDGFIPLTVPRDDVDVVFGVMPHPRVGIILGWKYIGAEYNYDLNAVLPGLGEATDEYTITGPAFGLALNFPLARTGLVIVANGSYMFLQGELKEDDFWGGGSETFDLNGYTVELGLGYSIAGRVGLNLGYKVQTLRDDEVDTESEDKFSGVTFSADYRF